MPSDATVRITSSGDFQMELGDVLMADVLAARRHDDMVSRQGVMNHQTSSHMMDLAFVRDHTELSIPESYAVQGMAQASVPRDAVGTNLASQTPKA